ncbi:Usher syndrome type-1C protein-binding protein 1 [Tachyglossus aculeatus]|uniref:Usher syndrome type-1C protein-binding protein 1 n=1 Tax=Tachyglossus aculeatus TaxID=9261 RepID=UPI0018F7899B|nr:Usher syndrome type-1C protein-binding protein 1 [Tachyglossus aculeatus]XP_038596246.1 Usher syndrome type-1C protein-binding protein 1 [Tachyglossus aculeatus]
MSSRANRPRSRRGRAPPPGELDPVAESAEETEVVAAAAGGPDERAVLRYEEQITELLVTIAELHGKLEQLQQARAREGEEDAERSSEYNTLPWEGRAKPPACGLCLPPSGGTEEGHRPNVFLDLQQAVTSLEKAAFAWRQGASSHQGTDPDGKGPVTEELGQANQKLEELAESWEMDPGGQKEGKCGSETGQGLPTEERSWYWREVASFMEQNASLRVALGNKEEELSHSRGALRAAQEEKERLQKKVQELQDSLLRLEPSSPLPLRRAGSISGSSSPGAAGKTWGSQDPIFVSHPLLRRARSCSSAQLLGHLRPQPQPLVPQMQDLEVQMEQLRGNIEKLKCLNQLLSAALRECKSDSEALSMRLGQQESDSTALRLALQYSEQCAEAYGVLLALSQAELGIAPVLGAEGIPENFDRMEMVLAEAGKLLAEEEPPEGRGAHPSPEGSSVDPLTRPANSQEAATLLRSFIQNLRERQALLKISQVDGCHPAPDPIRPNLEDIMQAVLGAQPGGALPRLEKMQILQELATIREALADQKTQLCLLEKEKRGLELRDYAHRAQGATYLLLLEHLQWELSHGPGWLGTVLSSSGGSSISSDSDCSSCAGEPGDGDAMLGKPRVARDTKVMAQELESSLARGQELQSRIQELLASLEKLASTGQVQRAQCVELTSDFFKAHSALVLAFRNAKRKQDEQLRQLDAQMGLMSARHAERLETLACTARVLEERRAVGPLGETSL